MPNKIFEGLLKGFSQQGPRELKILFLDNAGFHALKNITIPQNIIAIKVPPYSPKINPAEKVWQWMKDRVAMKIFKTKNQLQQKITQIIHLISPEMVKAITGYELYTKTFFEKFYS